jgi:hypothetical protein
MAKYHLAAAGWVFDTEVQDLIAPVADDPRWIAYQGWLANGHVADPLPEAFSTPTTNLSPHDRTFADDPFQPLMSE